MKEFVEKLINRLEEKVFSVELYNNEFDGKTVDNLICLGDVADIANQLAEEYSVTGGWIPCSVRLPERTKPIQTEEYTVTMRKITRVGKCSPFSSHASFDYESGKWLVKGFEVIAWQPLPAPYQPKG